MVLYAVDQTAAGLCLTLMWLYASRNHRLIDKDVTAETIRFITLRSVIVPIYFAASIAISFISPVATSLSWYGLLPLFALPSRFKPQKKRQKSAAKKPEAPLPLVENGV